MHGLQAGKVFTTSPLTTSPPPNAIEIPDEPAEKVLFFPQHLNLGEGLVNNLPKGFAEENP